MTKNKIFTEIKLAMRAGHYRDLTFKEKKIYKNAFKNGYKLAKIHCKKNCLLYTSPSPRDGLLSRMPSSA